MKSNEAFPSSYLKAADLGGKPALLTIDSVSNEDFGDDRKPVCYFSGHDKGLVLNRTNWNSIREITGSDESNDWHGRAIVVYPSETDFQGKRVPCLRVRAPKPGAAPTPPPPQQFQPTDDDVPF